MAKVLERINDIANTYNKINSSVIGQRQTGLKQVLDIVKKEKPDWAEKTGIFFPTSLEQCPREKCYEEAGFEPRFENTIQAEIPEDIVITNFEENQNIEVEEQLKSKTK